MTWVNALSTGAWVLLLAVPPLIVLLYFLKLRRQPLAVPSTYLWARTLEDMHVNSLWQRLRSSLLLILQLLLVGALILAVLRPGCQSDELVGERFIFLLDNSASMSATDLGGESRLQVAKGQIRNMIDLLARDDSAMLLTFSDRAEVIQSYTKDKELLKRRLASVQVREHSTDMSEALAAASGLANPGRIATEETDVQVADAKPAQLMIFSDGRARSNPDFIFGHLTAEYFPIGTENPHNVGIVAFAINDEWVSEGKLQAYAKIQNSYDAARSVNVSLYVNDVLYDAEGNVALTAGGATGVRFDLQSLIPSLTEPLKIRLQIDEPDDFLMDNVVFAVLNPPQPANILVVTPGNEYLRVALNTEAIRQAARVAFRNRDYLSEQDYLEQALFGRFDLVIYDQCQPTTMPQCNTMFIGNIPPGDVWTMGAKTFPTPLIDFDQRHPVMDALQLSRLTIVEAAALTGPTGTQTLLEATYGPIMAIGPRGGYQDLVLSFALMEMDEQGQFMVNSNWPSQLSFPLFIQNVVRVLGGGARIVSTRDARTGQIIALRRLPHVERVQVTAPDGQTYTVPRSRDGDFIFGQTDLRGWYTVTDLTPDGDSFAFAVNLLDPQESELRVKESLDIGGDRIEGTQARQTVRLEFWKWLVVVALVVLVVEWIIYNRRILL